MLIPIAEGAIARHTSSPSSAKSSPESVPDAPAHGEITLFKSLGLAVEDIAAARHVYFARSSDRSARSSTRRNSTCSRLDLRPRADVDAARDRIAGPPCAHHSFVSTSTSRSSSGSSSRISSRSGRSNFAVP